MDREGSWLRGLTGLLLVLNLGLLAVGLLIQNWPVQGRASRNMNAEQIRLAATLPQVASQQDDALASVAEQVPIVAEVSVDKRCLIWTQLDTERLLALDKLLTDAGLKSADYSWQTEQKLAWWVYLPPRPDATKMLAAVAAVRALGITDAAPVRGGSMLYAVSLGVFPSLDKARAHSLVMTKKGVSDVAYGLRPGVESIRLVLANEPEQGLSEGLRQAARGLMPEVCPSPATVPPAPDQASE